MVRLVNIVVPLNKVRSVLDKIIDLEQGGFVFQKQCFETERDGHVSLKAKDKHLQFILEKLHSVGCGVSFGQIDVLTLVLSKPPIQEIFPSASNKVPQSKKQRAYRISDRMTIDEIASFVDDGNHLTFNYLVQLAMASLIAGAGLLADSSTTVIASMLGNFVFLTYLPLIHFNIYRISFLW